MRRRFPSLGCLVLRCRDRCSHGRCPFLQRVLAVPLPPLRCAGLYFRWVCASRWGSGVFARGGLRPSEDAGHRVSRVSLAMTLQASHLSLGTKHILCPRKRTLVSGAACPRTSSRAPNPVLTALCVLSRCSVPAPSVTTGGTLGSSRGIPRPGGVSGAPGVSSHTRSKCKVCSTFYMFLLCPRPRLLQQVVGLPGSCLTDVIEIK